MRNRKLAGPILSLSALVLCMLGAEIFLYLFAPVSDPYETIKYSSPPRHIYSEFPPNYRLTTEAETGLPGVEGPKSFSINNMGFRGENMVTPKPQEEFRIFMIGGSTTECLYLDDSESINMILQNELAERAGTRMSLKVYGAGKSGDASDDHIPMLVHRIVHLEPDMIIVLSGINDLTRSIYDYDDLHYPRASSRVRYPMLKLFSTEFQIPRRMHYLLKGVHPTQKEVLETITPRSDYKQKIALRKSVPVSNHKPKTNLNAYSNNLKTIIGTAKAHKIQLVFMTQQTTWNSTIDPRVKDLHWMLYRNGVTYREDVMDEAIESLNDVIRQLSYKNNILIYDMAKRMPKSQDCFYDDVHFNVRGANFAGKQLALHILGENLIPKHR